MKSIKMTNVQAEMLTDFIEKEFMPYATNHPVYKNFSYIAEMTDLYKKLTQGKKTVKSGGKESARKNSAGDIHEQTLEEAPDVEKEEIEWIR